jgi:site-specific recombinase XerD
LAIPRKRHECQPVDFLSEEEAMALVAAPDVETWIGRRDRLLLLLAIQTGLRNGEIASLRRSDVATGIGAHVRCTGKGRKMRCTPLRKDVAALVAHWLREVPADAGAPLFPSARGAVMSADAIQRIVARHARSASRTCPSLAAKKVHPHTLRHTSAMDLLRRGVDQTVIALWLGHESTATTQIYVHADLQLKERALGRATMTGRPPRRYRPTDRVLAFLEAL